MIRLMVNGHHYHVDVSGSGFPIILLHGFTGDTSTWQVLRHSLETSFQVIAIDIIGHGKSDKPSKVTPYYMENVARDIIHVMDSLSLRQAHLLGYSMGGRLALYLGLYYPDRFSSLILESASAGLVTEEEREERRIRDNILADKIEANGITWFVDYWEQLSLWESQKTLAQEILETQRSQRLQNNPEGLANSLRGMGKGVQPNLWDMLPNLTLPIHLIVGEYDTKFLQINHEMAQQIPNVTMAMIKGAGHTAHLENPFEFIKQAIIV